MRSTTITKLAIGEFVADSNGAIGKVTRFTRDHVVIEWEIGEARHTDADLKTRGVVPVRDAL